MLGCAFLFSIVNSVCQKKNMPRAASYFLLILNIYIIFSASGKLLLFYLSYVLFTYILLLLIGRMKRFKKHFFALFCVLCTSIFFYSKIADLTGALPKFILLVGFSYNMLKAIDAIFWVYYTDEKIPLLTYANYMLYFPVFTAGPIFRYRDFIKTYNNPAPITAKIFEINLKRLIRGLFFKLVVVTLLSILFEKMTNSGYYRFHISFFSVVVSYFILFFDLSGYSDMAIAMGGFMGITVSENFKNPFSAASFTQFWRKWHVTLSDWIRDHIFVVVNGKKLSKYQSALIGFITMIVMSLWYDFSILTVSTGAYMGLCLAFENIFGLTTCSIKKDGRLKFYLRCFLVNFLFGINTLAYLLPASQIFEILKGFLKV